jgi:hypothetical protein
LDKQQIVLWVHRENPQVLNGHPFCPVVTSHSFSLEDPARERTVTDRSAVAKVFVRTMTSGESAEPVAFHDPGKSAPF